MTEVPALPLTGLDGHALPSGDHALALRYAPLICFDAREPFLPQAVGISVFRQAAASPSFPRELSLGDGIEALIEYAIWWDWDIQHLYELEHVWVYVGADGTVARVDASWHGDWNEMLDDAGRPPLRAGRPLLYAEPGKHALAPSPQRLIKRKQRSIKSCGQDAGRMGVHVTPLFQGIIKERKPLANRLVHTWLEWQRFSPSYDFSQEFDLRSAIFVPWSALFAWIPGRVARWLGHLRASIKPHEQRVLRIAHRGASAYAQENTSAALREAARLGADMVELDVRASADDQPIICHDSSLKRVYGIDGSLADHSWDSLRAMTRGRGGLLSLDEALSLCRELGLGLYLDIKALTRLSARRMLAAIRARHYLRDTIFGAFRPDWLADIKAALPEAQTSILFSAVDIDAVKLAEAIKADYVHPCWENRHEQPHRLLSPAWIEAARAADLGIVCWHEERPEEIAALKALGVDAICSDMPELLLKTPARQG